MHALAVLLAAACVSAPIHQGPVPGPQEGAPDFLPWIVAGPPGRTVVGYLFYYGPSQRAESRWTIWTGGQGPGGVGTKILWRPRRPGSSLLVAGRRLDAPGAFSQRFAPESTGRFFPSIVDVPAPGCWRLTVRSGRSVGRFAVTAVLPPQS